jgi:excisionase family DNA binding protein
VTDLVIEPATPAPTSDTPFLSLGPASRLLGVDPDTLRRWADDGRIPAWTTPGGHRRFDRRVLERIADGRRQGAATRPLASMGPSPARLQRAYRQHYATTIRTSSAATAPRDARERERFRREGRRLVETLIAYLDAIDDPVARAAAESAAQGVVDDHAIRLAQRGASLTESVSLFVTARGPFLAEIAGLGHRRSLDPARLAVLYEDASGLLDRLLMRFIGVHQSGSQEA